MASLPGMPGRLGLPAGTPQGSDAADPNSGGGGGVQIPADAPTIVNFYTFFGNGSFPIAPTTENNTLVVTSMFGGSVPYIYSTGTLIGYDTRTFGIYDGMPFYPAQMGARNPGDAANFYGRIGSVNSTGDCESFYFLELVPEGVTAIQIPPTVTPSGPLPSTGWPSWYFVYEITPALLDVMSDNWGTTATSTSGIFDGLITPNLGPDLAFIVYAKREFPDSGTISSPWPTDDEVSYSNIGMTWTAYPSHEDGVSGATTVDVTWGKDHAGGATNFYLQGLMGFKGINWTTGD